MLSFSPLFASRKTEDDGFTLLEVVIVIGVLGIISAIAIPSYGTVQSNARAEVASNVAKNAYAAFITVEHDGDPATTGEKVIADVSSPELKVSYNKDKYTDESDLCVTVEWLNKPDVAKTHGAGC